MSYFPVGGTVLELIWFNGLVVALVVGDDLCGSDSEIERGQGHVKVAVVDSSTCSEVDMVFSCNGFGATVVRSERRRFQAMGGPSW